MRKSELAFNADRYDDGNNPAGRVFNPQGILQVSPELTALLQMQSQSLQAHPRSFSSLDHLLKVKKTQFLSYSTLTLAPVPLLPRSFVLL